MTPLSTLLQQITPLPWHLQPIGSELYIEAQGPVLICDMQRNEPLSEPEVRTVERNAIYIKHAANVLPELVKALEGCVFVLGECSVGAEKLSELFPVKLEAARKALSLAQTIKEK